MQHMRLSPCVPQANAGVASALAYPRCDETKQCTSFRSEAPARQQRQNKGGAHAAAVFESEGRSGRRQMKEILVHLWIAAAALQRARKPVDATPQHATASQTQAVTGGPSLRCRLISDQNWEELYIVYTSSQVRSSSVARPLPRPSTHSSRRKEVHKHILCEPCDLPFAAWHDQNLHSGAAVRLSPSAHTSAPVFTPLAPTPCLRVNPSSAGLPKPERSVARASQISTAWRSGSAVPARRFCAATIAPGYTCAAVEETVASSDSTLAPSPSLQELEDSIGQLSTASTVRRGA